MDKTVLIVAMICITLITISLINRTKGDKK